MNLKIIGYIVMLIGGALFFAPPLFLLITIGPGQGSLTHPIYQFPGGIIAIFGRFLIEKYKYENDLKTGLGQNKSLKNLQF